MAENSLGINRTTADIVLDDERDFFVENKITHSFGSASEYYDSLDCRVNTDQYDRNLEWYKNGERQTSEHYPGKKTLLIYIFKYKCILKIVKLMCT